MYEGFEKIIAEISSDFINVKFDRTNDCILGCLEKLADFASADRSYLFLISEDGQFMSNTHEWCRHGIRPFANDLQDVSVDIFPWFKQKIFNHEVVSVSDVSALDGNIVKLKDELLRESIKSILCVPMICDDSLIGFIGFDMVVNHLDWPEQLIDLLRITGGIFASAIVRQRTERRLHESENMLRTVMDAIPARIFWKDTNGVFVGCNERFAQDAGFSSSEEVVGKTDYDFLWASSHANFYIQSDKKIMAEGKPRYGIVESLHRPDGKTIWIKSNKIPLYDDAENVVGILGTYHDITEEVKALDDLQKAKFCIDSAPDAIFWIKWDSTFLYVNNAACQMLGYTKEQLMKKSIKEIDPDVTEKNWPDIWHSTSFIGKQIIEVKHLTSDGRVIPVEVVATRIQFQGQEYHISFERDISKRKKAELEKLRIENERQALLDVLRAKTEELESIVYVSSHDLRTPLVNIQGFSGELAKSCTAIKEYIDKADVSDEVRAELRAMIDDDVHLSLGFISKSADKMDQLLKGLLKLSRIGRAVPEISRIDMNSTIKNVISTMRFQIDESGAELTVGDLPDCLADSEQIDQLFANLIDNAVKYLDPKRKGKISVTGSVINNSSVYCVQDNGIGIDPAYTSNIFEIFHRLDPTVNAQGQGLGLTIVKRIAARNKGGIQVESEPGKGSRFILSLPHPQPSTGH